MVAFKRSKFQFPIQFSVDGQARRTSRRTARCGRFREPRRCAGCGEGAWRAAGRSNAGTGRGRAGQPRRCCCRAPAWGRCRQPRAVTSHPRTRWHSRWLARLRGKVACATGCGSATVSGRRRQRSSSAVAHRAAATLAHYATACPGHRSLQQHAVACIAPAHRWRPTTALPVSPAFSSSRNDLA
jgi:hypothetical protein